MKIKSIASKSPDKRMEYFEFSRRELTPTDVEIEILFCGICHSDIHTARNEWKDFGPTSYPCVPGHEITGIVTRTGNKASSFCKGDLVGVGCMVGSCRKCVYCEKSLEQYCETGPVWTYNSIDPVDKSVTKGGYSQAIVVPEDFVLRLPDGADPAKTAPLLCAGITTYSPLKHWNIGKGTKAAIAGLGGLGHMGLKYAKAFGANTYVLTTSKKKISEAEKLGADGAVIMGSGKTSEKFDFILNTIPVAHDLRPYLNLLATDGVMVIVGALADLKSGFHGTSLISKRRSIAGSTIGGIRETQEMLDFSIKNGIYPEIDIITADGINEAHDLMVEKGISHRFVIDIRNSLRKV